MSEKEKGALLAFAVISFVGINGTFLYSLFVHPELLLKALTNPISLVFIIEALLLMLLLGIYLQRWGVTRMNFSLFVILSILGSLGFSVPMAILYKRRH